MPTTDDELVTRFAEAALEPPPTAITDVLTRVATKRHRRTRRRRGGAIAGTIAIVVALGGAVALLTPGDGGGGQVAVAPRAGSVVARVADGPVGSVTDLADDTGVATTVTARATPLEPDRGFVRGPVLVSGEFVAVATYDRQGDGYTFPPSRVVRVDADGRVLDEVDLQGEVLSLADGEGARWVLTRDAVVLGPQDPEYRVKRIGPSGEPTSAAVPPGARPVGPIVATGGGVWIPVADGVLRFDPATGDFAGAIPLAPADRRAVVSLGKGVSVTTAEGLARLDPRSSTAIAPTQTLPAGTEVRDVAFGARGMWALVVRDGEPAVAPIGSSGGPDLAARVPLPRDVDAERIGTTDGRVWVTGRAGGRPVVVLLRGTDADRSLAVDRVVVINGRDALADADVAVAGRDTLAVAAQGALWTFDLGARGD